LYSSRSYSLCAFRLVLGGITALAPTSSIFSSILFGGVPLVGDHVPGLDVFEQTLRLRAIIDLTRGDDEAQWTAQGVGEYVDLSAQPS
jgi:hypothetical protein